MPKEALRDIANVFPSGSRAAERPSHGGVGNSEGPHAVDLASNQYLKIIVNIDQVAMRAAQGFPP